ncbi:sigma-54-dependent transcriptional regulator [Desulfurobacterium indicum]|uniref:Fis family transcriptional regulator n=1 Tax=Desulfurobacterium indicum TaxID=1914305 RepID=A0A1R1MML0_9BACT|nr:sigma-54 dependent transcriptional regulator [Desulfurobacterium indicum]OMH41006.1 Fis family transcriptional regulator [Desulfurobacterium indicum]
MACKILVIEDDKIQRELLVDILVENGFIVFSSHSAEKGEKLVGQENIDVVITDVRLPGKSGIEFLKSVKRVRDVEVIVVTAFSNIDDAVKAIKLGAFHYITKPYDVDVLINLVKKCCELSRLRRALLDKDKIIFASPVMERILSMASLFAKADAPVLITGESGTGKEVIARYIHKESGRKGKFVPVNCTSIPENLFESELFGYEKGAFSGAVKSKPGLIEEADGGTLFLDEIGDLSLSLQAKLLRFLQEKEVRRVGGLETKKVDVKVVAATNRNLEDLVKEGKFREDLFYRLNVLRVKIPPLKQRKEDILELSGYFINRFSRKYGKQIALSSEAIDLLLSYDFPGNVRELENILHRAVLVADGEIKPEHLGINKKESVFSCVLPPGKRLPDYIDEIEKAILLNALEEANFVQTRAAKLLGIDEKSLRYKRKKYGI